MKRPKSIKKTANFTVKKYQEQNGRCFYCLKKFGDGNNIATMDHYFPYCEGGKANNENIVLACHLCNQRKGCISPDLFLDGYIQYNLGGREQGDDNLPSINIPRKFRGKRRFYHYFITW